MNSMTGYGRGETVRRGTKVTVEMSTVNRRQAELSLHMPRELDAIEWRVRDAILAKIARGRVVARVILAASNGVVATPVLDHDLAKKYAREYRRLAAETGADVAFTLDTLLRAPGVMKAAEEESDAETRWPLIQKALKRALVALVAMRGREGKHLQRDLKKRVALMRRITKSIRKQAPKTARRHREQLNKRLSEALGAKLDEERLLREVVLFADRADITEELTRLESHYAQFDVCAKNGGAMGRTLDFLAQEMNREVNTIGSKANDAVISRQVVRLKSELEKFREQVQNVE